MNKSEVIHQHYTEVDTNKSPKKKLNGPPIKRLLLPSVIFVAVITQVPFLITIYYSLHEWNIMRPDLGITFAGFKNFASVLSQPAFYEVLKNTFLLTLSILAVSFIFGFAFALLMNRNFFGKGLVRTMLVSPFFVMPTVSAIIWKTMMLNPNFGYSAYFANVFGSETVDWLAARPLFAIILIVSWQWVPFFMLILLAGLQSLPNELMEASQLDGANKLQQFMNVTIPHLTRYFEVVLLLGLMFILQVFGEIYVTTSGGPGFASTNLSFFVYRLGFQSWNVGEATAVGVITVILTIIMMMALIKVLKRTFKGELS